MKREELERIKAAILALKTTKRGASEIADAILEKYDGLTTITKTALKAIGLDALFERLRELTRCVIFK